jgi:hypothetical protein
MKRFGGALSNWTPQSNRAMKKVLDSASKNITLYLITTS